MKRILLLSLFSLIQFDLAEASDTSFCQRELERIPIQQKGRVKPLRVHAKEVIKFLTTKSSLGKLSGTQAYCLLNIYSAGSEKVLDINARIDHVKVKEIVGLKENEKWIPYTRFIGYQDALRAHYFQIPSENALKKAIARNLEKIHIYKEVISGKDWMLAYVNSQNKIEWVSFAEFLEKEDVKKMKTESKDGLLKALQASEKNYIDREGDHYLIELTYSKLHLTGFALLFTLLALASSVIFKRFGITLTLATASVLTQLAAITMRSIISGRAPITNMYETVLFSGLGALFIAMLIGHIKKEKVLVIVGLIYSLCTLFMITFANDMLPSDISPLVPVLRDNFWLSTHVTTIILSYGTLAISWIFANQVLIKEKFFKLTQQELVYYSDLIYTSMKWGAVLLAAGIILGGVWADYSWGRFWGWDPKETWSLIALLVYMAIIHGRYTSWIPPHRFIPASALAFLSIMMAWFGVNYILASGLHSYGFSTGGALFLAVFFAAQISVVILCHQRKVAKV